MPQFLFYIYIDGSKIETKVASTYVCDYGTRSYGLRKGCSIFAAEIEAINKALQYVKVSVHKKMYFFLIACMSAKKVRILL